jgi:hypothetical protein
VKIHLTTPQGSRPDDRWTYCGVFVSADVRVISDLDYVRRRKVTCKRCRRTSAYKTPYKAGGAA